MTDIETQKYQEFLSAWEEKGAEQAEEYAFDDWVRWKCLTDLFYLGYEVLGLKNARYRGGRKAKVIDPKLHKWMADVIQMDIDTLLLVPRGHLKSSWTKIGIIQRILRDPNIRIGLFSATASLAEAMIKDVKMTICHPLLMRLFPDVVIDPGKDFRNWEKSTANMMTIKRDIEDGKKPQEEQVEAYGVGANIVGRHFDIHFYDDLVTPDFVSTVAQINKLRDWYALVQAILSPDGLEKMTGTRYHYMDLYGSILEEGYYGKHVYVRKVEEGGKPIYNYFNKKMIEKNRKRMGNYLFSCQYENNPISREDQLFPPPQPTFDVLPDGEYEYFVSVDPAATVKAYSDYTGIAVGAIDRKTNILYIVNCFGVKKTGDDIARLLIAINDKYHPIRIGIEYGLQEHLKYIIANEVSKVRDTINPGYSLPTEGIKISKQSKYDRINWTLGAMVRGGSVKVQADLHALMTQMENLTPNYKGKDDLVDAASMLPITARMFGFQPSEAEREPWEAKGTFSFNEILEKFKQGKGTRNAKFIK